MHVLESSIPRFRLIGSCFAAAATAAAALSVPGCQSIAPTQNTITNVQTANLTLPGFPFGLVYASNDIAFGSLATGYVDILNTSTFTPTVIRSISLPAPLYVQGYSVGGLGISHDKRIVYVAVGPGAVAIDVRNAVTGEADAIAGLLIDNIGNASIEAIVSPDDKYVFVSQENGSPVTDNLGAIDVFNVLRANNGSISSTYVGYIVLGSSVVGSTLSPDGSKLYVTSELASASSSQGTLSILDVATLKTDPSKALLASVDAGCGPVRVAVSHNGEHVWVTARESNMLLAFEAGKLVSNSSDALVASVQVGTSPVGVTFVNHGQHLITADSNRFIYANATSGLTVVYAEAALKGKQGFPPIPTGLYPREFAVRPDGTTLLVSDYFSDMIQAINTTQLAYD